VGRAIVHLDMDAFYASVEQRDDPRLRGRPVIVGGPAADRGVVCAASYEARRFGVRSAMPSRTAARLCPQAVFLPVRMERYREESRAIFDVVRSTAGSAPVEQVSVDEAYLDVSAVVGLDGAHGAGFDDRSADAATLAGRLKAEIRGARALTATVGVASNKLLAKIASDHRKPDGLTVVLDRDRREFLRPLPCRTLFGVGAVTEEVLAKAGFRTIGDIQDHSGDLRPLLGSYGPILRRFAEGDDDRSLDLDTNAKSLGSETTFSRDTANRPELRACLRSQAEELAERLKRRALAARTVQVKVRYSDFRTLTRQISVETSVSESGDIYRLAAWLMARHRLAEQPLRLLGVSVSGLAEAADAVQLLLPLKSSRKP
jgi:DNA polymerase IV